MSYIYTFSEDSKPLLQQCLNIAATLPLDDNNKWLRRFGPQNLDLYRKTDDMIYIQDSPEIDVPDTPAENQDDVQKIVEALTDPDLEIASQFEFLYKKCCNTPKLLTKLAENLPIENIEKLTHHIFDATNVENQFIQDFYENFVSVYLKKGDSRLCTELLLKTYKFYAHCFKILLKVIFKDTSIQNSVINDFILALNADQQTELINDICNIELSTKEFSHNLFNIYTLYKSCSKAQSIQNYVLSLLKTNSHHCSTDKTFGKLLLAYLQQEKNIRSNVNYTEIETIIETHKSPFKRPCLAIFEEINNS